MLRQYRADSYPVTLYVALGLTAFLHAAHLVFSVLRSTPDEFVKTSIHIWWGVGLVTLLGVIAIYFDAGFVNRGQRYDADIFYPLVQAGVLQGVASLACLVIRIRLPSR